MGELQVEVEAAEVGLDSGRLARLDWHFRPYVDDGRLPGWLIVVSRGGRVAHLSRYGQRDREQSLPVEVDTIWRLASMTKPITSVAAMMLYEEGAFELKDPVARWIPAFENPRVYRSGFGARAETRPAVEPIRVWHLLTHTAGLTYGFHYAHPVDALYRAAGFEWGAPPDLDLEGCCNVWAALPLLFEPGTEFNYSVATDVLGRLVEVISGQPLDDFFRTRIFEPLGMTDTDFYVPPAKRERAAVVYRLDEKLDRLEPVPFRAYDAPPAYCGGGGGLVSTLDDYLKFARMLLSEGELDGRRYLKPDTVRQMRTNRLTDAQREIPFMGIPFWAGQGFGLGLSVITDPEKQAWMGGGSKGAFGWPGAFGTWWQASPEDGLILIYLVQNSMPLGPEAAAQLATGQRMAARAALPVFQKIAYAAIGK